MKVALGDVEDVRQYVGGLVYRCFRGAEATHGEEEIIAEGLTIIFELHADWLEDDDGQASFNRYVGRRLHTRLLQWLRDEDRMRGIRYRSHRGGYVDLRRQSIEELTATESEPSVQPVFA